METLDTTHRSAQPNNLLQRLLNRYELADGTIIGTGFVVPQDAERLARGYKKLNGYYVSGIIEGLIKFKIISSKYAE